MIRHKAGEKAWMRIAPLGLIFVATVLWGAAASAQEPIKIGFSVSTGHKQVIVHPAQYKDGELQYPFAQ